MLDNGFVDTVDVFELAQVDRCAFFEQVDFVPFAEGIREDNKHAVGHILKLSSELEVCRSNVQVLFEPVSLDTEEQKGFAKLEHVHVLLQNITFSS